MSQKIFFDFFALKSLVYDDEAGKWPKKNFDIFPFKKKKKNSRPHGGLMAPWCMWLRQPVRPPLCPPRRPDGSLAHVLASAGPPTLAPPTAA